MKPHPLHALLGFMFCSIATGATTVSGGKLIVNGSALADTSSLILNGDSVEATGTEPVDTLYFGATQQSAGTWGASGSGAAHLDNVRFSGATGVINVTTGPGLSFSTWADANAGGGNPDGDGVPNGVEFFMEETGSSFTSNPALVGGTVTWPKNPSAIATYVVQTSTNLLDEVIPGDGGWSTVPSGGVHDGTSVTYTLLTGGPKRFTRIKVTIP